MEGRSWKDEAKETAPVIENKEASRNFERKPVSAGKKKNKKLNRVMVWGKKKNMVMVYENKKKMNEIWGLVWWKEEVEGEEVEDEGCVW